MPVMWCFLVVDRVKMVWEGAIRWGFLEKMDQAYIDAWRTETQIMCAAAER